jgi:hypothetical protein
MKNISVGDIKPKDDEDDKDGRVENKETHISHDQMVTQGLDDDPSG